MFYRGFCTQGLHILCLFSFIFIPLDFLSYKFQEVKQEDHTIGHVTEIVWKWIMFVQDVVVVEFDQVITKLIGW